MLTIQLMQSVHTVSVHISKYVFWGFMTLQLSQTNLQYQAAKQAVLYS